MRTGLAHARHRVIVATWRRIFKEAGTNIPDRNVERYIRDTHLRNSPVDGRRLDLVSQGISGVFGGKPLFMDATCISPVRGSGVPMARAATEDGAVLSEKDKDTYEVDYPDVAAAPHAQLLSLSVETYGRWGKDCLRLVKELARAKASFSPEILRVSVQQAYGRRWWALLSVCVQKFVSDSILQEQGADLTDAIAHTMPPLPLADVFDFCK